MSEIWHPALSIGERPAGTVLFIAVLLPALFLGLLSHKLTALGASQLTVYVMKAAEYAIIIVDVFLYFVFLATTAWQYIREAREQSIPD